MVLRLQKLDHTLSSSTAQVRITGGRENTYRAQDYSVLLANNFFCLEKGRSNIGGFVADQEAQQVKLIIAPDPNESQSYIYAYMTRFEYEVRIYCQSQTKLKVVKWG